MKRIVALFLFTSLSFAAKPPKLKPVDRFEKAWETTKNFQAKFKQTVSGLGNDAGNPAHEGTVSIEKPNKLLWVDTTDGTTQLFDGKKYYHVQKNENRGNRSVSIMSDTKQILANPFFRFLSGRAKLKELYEISQLGSTSKTDAFQLTLKTNRKENLIAVVRKDSYVLQILNLEDATQKVVIEFFEEKANQKFGSETFKFKQLPNDIVHTE